jgi:2-methylisocitrate lyase-like PEP mutase family enzyme
MVIYYPDMTDPSNSAPVGLAPLAQRCELLRGWHVRSQPLVLPNAWDAASARAVVDAGFRAVATTSSGVALSLGYEDHQGAPPAEMFAAAARIARAVEVPVTVDAEAGYGLPPDELVARLAEVGAAGANLEDSNHTAGGLRPSDEQAAWLASVREAADRLGYPLVVNARIDTFIAGAGQPQEPLVEDAAGRAAAYLAAGADCVYPILLREPDARRAFLAAVDGAVNLLTWPGGATVAELAADGAARVSYGGSIHRVAMQHVAEILKGVQA